MTSGRARSARADPQQGVSRGQQQDLTQLRIQQGSPDAVTLVSSPVRAGKHAAKMLLRATDPEVAKGKRTEFIDARTMKAKGCVLGGLICKAQVWRRIDSVSASNDRTASFAP